MFKSILKLLGKSVKKTTESVGKSMEFVDDVIEKEYIVGAVESVKEATGDVVEKAGKMYQKTKDNISDTLENEQLKSTVDSLKRKGKELSDDFKEKIIDQSETMKNVMDEGEKMVDKLFGEEE